MKRIVLGSIFVVAPLVADKNPARVFPVEQYISTLRISVYETEPKLMERSQKLVIKEVNDTMDSVPEVHERTFQLTTHGNEILFQVATAIDMRERMQKAVAQIIEQLNGQVRARGQSRYYRTDLNSPEADLFVQRAPDRAHIDYVSVRAVPLLEVLKELQAQLGKLSYTVPGSCAEKRVNWKMGLPGKPAGKSVDEAMMELAELSGLNYAKNKNTYAFNGECDENEGYTVPIRPHPTAADYLPAPVMIPQAPSPMTQVFFPLD